MRISNPYYYLSNKIKFIFISKFYDISKREPNLKPNNQEKILGSIQIKPSLPLNYEDIKTVWKPQSWFLETLSNDTKIYYFQKVFISIDGIVFNSLKSFSKSFVYKAFYKKFNIYYLLDNYKNKKLQKGLINKKYLLIFDHWSKSNYYH